MNNLIKAEWYRFRHSGHLFFYCSLSCFVIFMIALAHVISVPNISLAYALTMFNDLLVLMFPIVYSIAIGICIGKAYQNRTAHYEIMNGSRSSHIIISKLIIYVSFFTGITVILFGSLFTAIVISNGTGRLEQLGLRMFLLIVVLFHICSVSALIALIVRNGAAPLFAFFRAFIIDIFIMSVLGIPQMVISALSESELYNTICEYILNYLISEQLTFLLDDTWPISSQLVTAIIGGTIIECIFWYVIAYFGFQKQRF